MNIDKLSTPNIILVAATSLVIGHIIYLWRTAKNNAKPAQLNLFQKPVKWFAIVYGAYLSLIFVLGGIGFFGTITVPPRFILIMIPIFITVILIVSSKTTKALSFLALIPPASLVIIQAFRMAIEFGLTQFYAQKIIPVELSLHGRNFDIIIGLLAIPAGYLLYKKHPMSVKFGIAFNILGLISFINITSIAVTSFPSVFRIYETNYLPTYFPGILITFLAPAACYFHVLSIRQLIYKSRLSRSQNNNS